MAKRITTEEEVETKNFLKEKIVVVKPVVRVGQWSNLLKDGKAKKDAFLFNKSRRTYSVPIIDGGRKKRVLDNIKPYLTPQFKDEGPLTQEQFFERMLDEDLSLYKKEDNFWETSSLAIVELSKGELKLDLSIPEDMIKYLVLISNSRKIANYDVDPYTRMSYEFYVVDVDQEKEKKQKEVDVSETAMEHYFKLVKTNYNLSKDILRVKGHNINSQTEKWIKTSVFSFVKDDPKEYLKLVNDGSFEDKAFIEKGIAIGDIRRLNLNKYSLEGKEIGTLNDLIAYLNNPLNSISKTKLKERINNSTIL